jgi:hypothetical protein
MSPRRGGAIFAGKSISSHMLNLGRSIIPRKRNPHTDRSRVATKAVSASALQRVHEIVAETI